MMPMMKFHPNHPTTIRHLAHRHCLGFPFIEIADEGDVLRFRRGAEKILVMERAFGGVTSWHSRRTGFGFVRVIHCKIHHIFTLPVTNRPE
jgi:hypothetical protein